MTTATETQEYIVVAYNELSYNCETLVGDEYWAHYQLGNQENGAGCLYSEALRDGWEECDENEEEIVVSTPGISIPEWCGECEVVWQLLKKEDKICGGYEYTEFGLIPQDDESSLAAWYRWYDSNFSDEDPAND